MQNNQEFDDIISYLSYNEGYFYVRHRSLSEEYYSPERTLLIYSKTHVKTFQQLLQIYVEAVNKKDLKDIIKFQLECENKLPLSMTLEQLKMKLRRGNLDGVNLFAYEDNRTFADEAASTKYIESELQYNQNSVDVSFVLPNITYSLYLPIKGGKSTTLKLIKQQLKTQILRVFSVDIDINNIRLLITDPLTNQLKKAQMKDIEQIFNQNTQIFVEFSDNLKLKEPPKHNNHFIVIKDTSIKNFKSKTLAYDNIKHQKVIDILRNIQKRDKWEDYGLRIGDIALKPNDIFENKTKHLFKNSTKHSKHIAALIILQEHIFQLQTKLIAENNKLLNLNNVVAKHTQSKNLIQVCESIIGQRQSGQSNINKSGKKIKMGTIYYYTTQLKVSSSDNKDQKLYKVVNEMLRSMKFCQVSPDQYLKWQYNYISHLYHDLKNADIYTDKQTLWRGISKPLIYKLGQIIVFKQFTSFSMEKNRALSFGNKTLFKLTKSQSGRPIKDFSHTQYEKQVLFLSYSRFKVVGFDKNDKDSTNVIQIEQIPRIKMPQMQVMMIFWIDDKTATAKMYWQNFEHINKSIVMIQLLNTQQFSKWFESNKQIAQDLSVEMTMISNMSRIQNGVRNQKAGVESAQIFRKHRPSDRILFFVGRKNKARENLAQKNLKQEQNLKITDDQVQLYEFLYQIAGLN